MWFVFLPQLKGTLMNSDQAADVRGRGLVVGPAVTVTVRRLQTVWLHFP